MTDGSVDGAICALAATTPFPHPQPGHSHRVAAPQNPRGGEGGHLDPFPSSNTTVRAIRTALPPTDTPIESALTTEAGYLYGNFRRDFEQLSRAFLSSLHYPHTPCDALRLVPMAVGC